MNNDLKHTNIFESVACDVPVQTFKHLNANSINFGLAFVDSIALWLDTQGAIYNLKFSTCNTENSASTKDMLVRGLNHRKCD